MNWAPIGRIVSTTADILVSFGSDEEVATEVSRILGRDGPDAMFVQFDEVDVAGHDSEFSPGSSDYLAAIESVDALVGRLVDAVEDRRVNTDEDWLVRHSGSLDLVIWAADQFSTVMLSLAKTSKPRGYQHL